MNLTLIRQIKTGNSTIGSLLIDGVFFCYTLELPWRDNHPDTSCIPLGIYKTALQHSERFDQILPHILNVPGREDILIHAGNFPHDTHGCILVGCNKDVDVIENSREALKKLLSRWIENTIIEIKEDV